VTNSLIIVAAIVPFEIIIIAAVYLAGRRQRSEAMNSWSQKLGHEGVLTTLTAYGAVSPSRQTEIILSLGKEEAGQSSDTKQIFEALGRRLGYRPLACAIIASVPRTRPRLAAPARTCSRAPGLR
jgi:hypothetical protein